MNGTDVAVVIPSWNGRHLLELCLDALARSTLRAQVVVVDNGSSDGTEEWLRASHPSLRVIRNGRNVGFAAAINQGFRATASPWLAPLNNDAVPEPDWLSALVEVAENDNRVGAVASRMMFRDAPGIVSSAGIRMDPSFAAWDLLLGSREWPTEPCEVFGASAGACLYRRAMLDDVGILDEGSFAYLEDVDLAWRARLRGWKARLAPAAVVHHALSATAREGSAFKRFYLARNKWRVLVRCVPWTLLVKHLPVIVAYDGLSLGNSLAHGDLVPLFGRLAAAEQLPRLLRERRDIQKRRTASQASLQSALSPLEAPLRLYRRSRLATRLAARSLR